MSNHKMHVATERRALLLSIGGAAIALYLTGSAHAQTDKVNNEPSVLTVKVPVAADIERSGKFFGFRFGFTRSTRKGDVTEYQRLDIKELPSGVLQFHRRSDNGVAGSGVVTAVKFAREESPTEVTMTFEEGASSKYQEGLFLKKPIPEFTLKSALLAGTVSVKFEVNSDYALDATRASFQRLGMMLDGTPGGAETYRITTAAGPSYVQVRFFPYRSGTKAAVSATVSARETSPGVVDFGVLIKELETAVKGIVQS